MHFQWSKATYTYSVAATLLQLGGEKNTSEALDLMKKVPEMRQRIAGKSIPLEVRVALQPLRGALRSRLLAQKFVARKARKAQSQSGLMLPGVELAAVFGAIARAPRDVLARRMLPVVDDALAVLRAETDAGTTGRAGFWDDSCLARFLEGIIMLFIAYPVCWCI
jgi:hypothetical protein